MLIMTTILPKDRQVIQVLYLKYIFHLISGLCTVYATLIFRYIHTYRERKWTNNIY